MNIKQILNEAIGEDKEDQMSLAQDREEVKSRGCNKHYNQAKAELRAKIPEIEKKIVEEIEKTVQDYMDRQYKLNNGKLPFVMFEGRADENEKVAIYMQGVNDVIRIINHLTNNL